MTRYVFDSFALIAYFENEPGAAQMDALLAGKHERFMTSVNLGEVYYLTVRRRGHDVGEGLLDDMLAMSIELVEPGLELTLQAARMKAVHPLSYADCFAAALAAEMDATLVTGDPEFVRLDREGIVRIEWLPAKPKRASR